MQKQIVSHGYQIEKDKNGHWSIYDEKKRIIGPWFNKPTIWKRFSKGELRIMACQNPDSDNPNFYIIDSDSKFK